MQDTLARSHTFFDGRWLALDHDFSAFGWELTGGLYLFCASESNLFGEHHVIDLKCRQAERLSTHESKWWH